MQQMDQQMNRQQKIMAAKASFRQTGDNAGFFYRGDFKGNSFEGAGSVEEENPQTPVFHFGLVRFMASLMLLLLLLGFGQEYVRKCMQDESAWNRLESKVQKVCRNVSQKPFWSETFEKERISK